MSKELKALDFIQEEYRYQNNTTYRDAVDLIRSALIEKEDIDNANPNEALEGLKEIIELITANKKVKHEAIILFNCSIIKDALLKAQKLEKEFYCPYSSIVMTKQPEANSMKEYRYLISYHFANDESAASGFGDVSAIIKGELTYSKIEEIRTKIKELNNFSTVVILNAIRLEEVYKEV